MKFCVENFLCGFFWGFEDFEGFEKCWFGKGLDMAFKCQRRWVGEV